MEEPKPREKYSYFKGGHCEVMLIATDSSDIDKKRVVYRNIYNPEKIWSRPLEEFCGYVESNGIKEKIFTKIE